MLKKSRLLVCLLIFAVNFSSFGLVARAQETDGVSEKLRVISEESKKTQNDLRFNTANENLIPLAAITVNPNLAVPDDAYNGTLTSMACSTINTTALIPAGTVVSNVSINVSMTHTWVGDLTIKLRSPNGSILTVLNRPGSTAPDNGADAPVGDSSNWSGSSITFADGAGPEAETMGSSIGDAQSICTNDGICSNDPSPDTAPTPPTSFANLNDQDARGEWTLCVGDSNLLDAGTLNSWSLNIIYAYPVTATPNLAIPDDGYAGGFGGLGQACSTINTTGLDIGSTTVNGVYVDVDLNHTWVGDLTIKLRSPSGTIFTMLNRPGSTAADDGGGAIGANANWNGFQQFRDGAGPEAETMGAGLTTDQLVCPAGALCKYDPSPDTAASPASFAAAFNGQVVNGNWTLCIGDSALGDVGTLRSWRLNLVSPSGLIPTAASAFVGGRVFNAYGQPVSNAAVSLANTNGEIKTTRTNPFGYYSFYEVSVGETYAVTVQSKAGIFTPRIISPTEDIAELNFTAQP